MKLKPCPFCGEVDVKDIIVDDCGDWHASITCSGCGIGFRPFGYIGGGCDIEAVERLLFEAWDRRV